MTQGLKLQLLDLGVPTLLLILVTVALTFGVTLWLGHLMGLPPAMALFIAAPLMVVNSENFNPVERNADFVALVDALAQFREPRAMFDLRPTGPPR